METDKFWYHLYYRGDVQPDASIEICVVGGPTMPVLLGMGSGNQDPPQSTPYGDLYLMLPLAASWPLGPIPPEGVLIVPSTVPTSWSSDDECPFQALVGPLGTVDPVLTNLMVLAVQ